MRRFRSLMVAVLACGVVASGCTGTTRAEVEGENARAADPTTTTTTTTSTTTSTTSTSTTVAPETTLAPEVLPPEETTTTVPPWQAPPVPQPVLGPDGQFHKAPTVRPAAAWLGGGVPAPGSMFENFAGDASFGPFAPVVALTFDDGPGQYTREIANILRFYGVPATFFMLTPQAERRPELVAELIAEGFRIGSHTTSHPHLADLNPLQQIDEIAGAVDRLSAVTGPGVVKCVRPPYGQYDQYVLDLVGSKGMATAMWSLDTLDWQKPDWPTIVQRVLDHARHGSVILMHDAGGDRASTIAALPWIIQGLRDRGFQFGAIC